MNKLRHGLRLFLIKHLALPSDVLLELPRITMIGEIHVYIENHQGLTVYSDSELTLKTHKGFIQILGSAFVLKMMHPEEILLEGKISEVKFIPD